MVPFLQFGSLPDPSSSAFSPSTCAPLSNAQSPTRPAKALARTYAAVPLRGNPQGRADIGTAAQGCTAFDASDLERSRPATPDNSSHEVLSRSIPSEISQERTVADVVMAVGEVEVLQSVHTRKNRARLAVAALVNLTNGMTDSAAGALLPYMERHYSIGYGVVSLLFVATAAGSVAAAFVVDRTKRRLGRARTLVLVELLMALGVVPMLLARWLPFAAVVAGFIAIGVGEAVNVALGNTFCGGLQQSALALGVIHAAYGLGGISGPLIATATVAAHVDDPVAFARFYFVPCSLCILNAVLCAWSYSGYERDEHAGADTVPMQPWPPTSLSPASLSRGHRLTRRVRDFAAAPSARIILLGALFLFLYQGVEVSIAGWVTSFLLAAHRGAREPSVGYVTSGFWVGITLGRVGLVVPAQRVHGGVRFFVYGTLAGSMVFELLVWFVPNVVGDAVAVAIVGLLLGPVYPSAADVLMRGLTRRERVLGIGVMAAFGSAGGAAAPFVTGVLAQALGPYVLHPTVIILMAVMLVVWYLVPEVKKPTE